MKKRVAADVSSTSPMSKWVKKPYTEVANPFFTAVTLQSTSSWSLPVSYEECTTLIYGPTTYSDIDIV